MADKPVGVMPLCIIAIALGAMGLLGGLFGLGALILNPKTNPPAGHDAKMTEVNVEFAARMEKVTKEARPVQFVLIPAMLLTSLLLAGAGIAGVKYRGRPFIVLAFGASLLIDTAGAIYGMLVQARTLEIMKWYFKEVAASTSSGKMPPGMEMGMQVGLYTGLFIGLGWLVAKTVFYVLGLVYFNKKSVREAFESALV